MISVMESVLREAAAVAGGRHESWSPHLRMQISKNNGCNQTTNNGFMEIASSTSYLSINEEDDSSPVTAVTPTSRDQDSPQTTMESRLKKSNKTHRDPTSHRVIEKRRRDRMNNCLTNLSKLIPSTYLKKGRGRIEKTEIIEMAIRYMKDVDLERRQQQQHLPQKRGAFGENMRLHDDFMLDKGVGTNDDQPMVVSQGSVISSPDSSTKPTTNDRYRQGFFDCVAETVRFLAGAEGLIINEQIKTKLLMHLRDYFSAFSFGAVDSTCSLNEPKRTYYCPSSVNQQQEDYCCPSAVEDEPLNMSIKRPRLSSDVINTGGGILQCGTSTWSSGGGGGGSGGGSMLRGILECKDNSVAAVACGKTVDIKREILPLPLHPPRAVPLTVPLAQIQHRFTSILEQPACVKIPSAALAAVTFSGSGGSSGGSTQYPSSPSSSASYGTDSPPHSHSPASTSLLRSNNHHSNHRGACHHHGNQQHYQHNGNNNNNGGSAVPVFALHPLGLFYVPLIVNSCCLEDASFQSSVTSSTTADHVQSALAVSHPVTISVNFNFSASVGNGYYANGHNNDQRTERSHHHHQQQTPVQSSGVILATSSLVRPSIL